MKKTKLIWLGSRVMDSFIKITHTLVDIFDIKSVRKLKIISSIWGLEYFRDQFHPFSAPNYSTLKIMWIYTVES